MKILLVLFVLVLSFVAFVRYLERSSAFHPARKITSTPRDIGLKFEDIYFKTRDHVLINGWLIKNPLAKQTLIYLHGNAGNLSDRLDKIKILYDVGMNVFIIDYRGFGKSHGTPSEHGLYEDALQAYDYLLTRNDIDPGKIGVYGASLGGAVAIDLATKRPLTCLIVDSSFSSAADMGKAMYPFIPSFLIQTKLDSASKIPRISIPKLFIHSPQDDVIPFKLGKKLFDMAGSPKAFLEVSGGHNDSHIVSKERWIAGVTNFLKYAGAI